MVTDFKYKNVSGEKYSTVPKYSDFDIFCMLDVSMSPVSWAVWRINDIAKLFCLEDNKYDLILQEYEELEKIREIFETNWNNIEKNREVYLQEYSEFIEGTK